MDYDLPRDVTNKRMSKAMDRTKVLNEQTFEYGENLAVMLWVLSLNDGFKFRHPFSFHLAVVFRRFNGANAPLTMECERTTINCMLLSLQHLNQIFIFK